MHTADPTGRTGNPEADTPSPHRRRALITIATVLLLTAASTRSAWTDKPTSPGFEVPDAAQRAEALGSLRGLTEREARAYPPSRDFKPMSTPQPGEWLDKHTEFGQSFEQFVKSRSNRPDKQRSTIYFLPLGDFDPEWSPEMSDLKACAAAFFQTPVKLLPPSSLADLEITTRVHAETRQYLSRDFLKFLPSALPADGFAVLGLTMEDLYPAPDWNYVFGQASLRERVGIHSFIRYDPKFWDEPRTPAARKLLFRRSLIVLLHETCHMFGMSHCIYYRCLVNGSNHLPELDGTPLHLCPICLRKLQHAVGFDVVARDEALLREYRRLRIDDETAWLERRLKFVTEQ